MPNRAAPMAPFLFGAIVRADVFPDSLHRVCVPARTALGDARSDCAGRRLPGDRPWLHPVCGQRPAPAATLAHGTPARRIHGTEARASGLRRLPATRGRTLRRTRPHGGPLEQDGRGLHPQPLQSAGPGKRTGRRGALQPVVPPVARAAARQRPADARADGLAVFDEGAGRVAASRKASRSPCCGCLATARCRR